MFVAREELFLFFFFLVEERRQTENKDNVAVGQCLAHSSETLEHGKECPKLLFGLFSLFSLPQKTKTKTKRRTTWWWSVPLSLSLLSPLLLTCSLVGEIFLLVFAFVSGPFRLLLLHRLFLVSGFSRNGGDREHP